MSFGSLSAQAKEALGRGATFAGTSTTTGDGGMTSEERGQSETLIYQYLPSRYGMNPDDLRKADAIEVVVGQGAKPGGGGMLLGQKISDRVAEMRNLPKGIDQRSACRHPDWTGPDDLEIKINELRVSEAKNFFDKFEMLECKINDDIISLEKPGVHNPINFHMHQFGNTQQIMKEAKAFAIDQGSIAECLYLTKYFGMNNITKTTENKFIFSKGNQSAVLSKYKW